MGLLKRRNAKGKLIYWIDFHHDGRRYRRTAGGSRKEAQLALDQVKGEIASGTFDPNEHSKKSVEEGRFDRCLADYLKRQIDDRGKRSRSYDFLRKGWLPAFAKRSLRTITSDEIESRLDRWTATRGWTPATRNNHLGQLSGFFTYAVGKRWVDVHPIGQGRVAKLSIDNGCTRWLRMHEIDALCEHSPDWLQRILRFAVASGMRRGEITDLRRSNYSTNDDGQPVVIVEHTKNSTAHSWPLVGEAARLVAEMAEACPFPGSFLFPGPAGRGAIMGIRTHLPIAVRAAGMEWGRYVQKYDAKRKTWKTVRDAKGRRIPNPKGVTFHTLRHSMASLLLNAGVPGEVVQKAGNWKDPKMVARYAHLSDATLREAAGVLSSIVLGDGPKRSGSGTHTSPTKIDRL